jgi:hypothetical protein
MMYKSVSQPRKYMRKYCALSLQMVDAMVIESIVMNLLAFNAVLSLSSSSMRLIVTTVWLMLKMPPKKQ